MRNQTRRDNIGYYLSETGFFGDQQWLLLYIDIVLISIQTEYVLKVEERKN